MEFHLAPYVDAFTDWLLIRYGELFDTLSDFLLAVLLFIQRVLAAIPWWVAVACVVLLAWWLGRKVVTAITLGLLTMVVVVFGLWPLAIESLAIVITAVVIALGIGIPLGVLMAEFRPINTVMQPILDGMQTMPGFVYLIPALMFFGLGKVPAILATFIYAVPPITRLTNLGIRQVSAQVQEAAKAYGATRWQMLKEVRLPLAAPSIMAGVNQTTMMALSMVVIAAMIGARGIGEEVLLSINRIDVGRGFEAGISVVVLAIVIDRLTQMAGKRWEPQTRSTS